jgi:hypothetical protein
MNPEEQAAANVAAADQAKAALSEMAGLQAHYYLSLINEGVHEWAALELVQQWTEHMNDSEDED